MKMIKFRMFNQKNNKFNLKMKKKNNQILKISLYKIFKNYVQCAENQNAQFFAVEYVEEDIIKNVFKKFFQMMILFLPLIRFYKLE